MSLHAVKLALQVRQKPLIRSANTNIILPIFIFGMQEVAIGHGGGQTTCRQAGGGTRPRREEIPPANKGAWAVRYVENV